MCYIITIKSIFHFHSPCTRPTSEAGYNIGSSFLKRGSVAMRKKIYCPDCGKWLFTVDTKAKGIVYVWCRYCRKEIKIVLESL